MCSHFRGAGQRSSPGTGTRTLMPACSSVKYKRERPDRPAPLSALFPFCCSLRGARVCARGRASFAPELCDELATPLAQIVELRLPAAERDLIHVEAPRELDLHRVNFP